MKKYLLTMIAIVLLFLLLPIYSLATNETTGKQKTVIAYDISLDDSGFWTFCDHLSKKGDTGGYYDSSDPNVGYMGHYGITTRHFNNESGGGYYVYKFAYINDANEMEYSPYAQNGYVREPDVYILPAGQGYVNYFDCDYLEQADYAKKAGYDYTGLSFGPIARSDTYYVYIDKTAKKSVEYLKKSSSDKIYTYKAHKADDGNYYNLAVKTTDVDIKNLEPVIETSGNEDDTNQEDTTNSTKIKSATLSKKSYVYDGKTKKPGVTIKNALNKTLKEGTDYKISYSSGRKNVGEYKVTITFKGKYKNVAKKTLKFNIVPKGTSLKSLKKAKKSFTVKWKKQKTQTTGYQIQYSTSKKFKNAKAFKVSNLKTVSRTIGNLKTKTKYYVRIRTYKTVNKKTYYSSWSDTKTVKTK